MKIGARLAIVGVGRWGRNLVRVFAETPRARVAALCDLDPKALSDLRRWLPRDSWTTVALEDVLESNEIDAVVVATPPETHGAIASRALQARKHVFVEKPMALSAAEAEHLRDVASAGSRKLMVGHVLLYHPAVDELSKHIRNGGLGVVRAVRCVRVSSSRGRHAETAWWALAPHDVSLARRLFAAHPREVCVSRQRGTDAGELLSASLAFPNGSTATIEVGMEQSVDLRRVLVSGSRRTALFDDRAAHEKLKLFAPSEGAVLDPRAPVNGPYYAPGLPPDEPLAVEARHFIDAILDAREIASDGAEGCAVTEVLEAGALSLARDGAPCRIPTRHAASQRYFFGSVSVRARNRS